MKKTYIGYSVLAAVLALSAQQANAQQGFGTDKPSKASVVEMTSGSKGLLIPRVALTSLDSFAPVSGEAPTDVDKTDALLVYNTATSDAAVADEEKVTPGYYYWTTDGTSGKWNRIATGADAKAEPWFDQATNTEATDNEQNIYQMGSVAIGKNAAATGVSLDVDGAARIGSGHTGAVGNNSVALGSSNEASGLNSIALGIGAIATQSAAIAIGNYALASGDNSIVLGGFNNTSSGIEALSGGRNSNASGVRSIALGHQAMATDLGAIALGTMVSAEGIHSIVLGGSHNISSGSSSISGGSGSEASGNLSLALGENTLASGGSAFALGTRTIASGAHATAMGFETTAASTGEIAMGQLNAITTPISNINWESNDALLQLGNGANPTNRWNALTILKNGNTAIGVYGQDEDAKPTERLDIGLATGYHGGKGSIRIRAINSAAYAGNAATDKIVVADADGVLKTITVASITPDAVDANNGLTKTASDIIQLGGDLNKDTKITLDENELEIDATDSELIISGLDKTKVQATNATTGITDHLLAVDANNNVKALKAAMPKFFYMPSIIVPTSQEQLDAAGSGKLTGDDFDNTSREGTINLYNRYAQQFGGSTLIKSETAAPALPVLPSGELYYYVTWYDTNVFTSVSVDDEGVLTYEVDENADITVGSFMNIVFAVKEGL